MSEFNAASLTRRQNAVFDAECQCTKAMHAEYRGRYESAATRPRTLVIDGTTFRWEGLGNSGTRWMGLLRWGFATGRQVYLQIGRDCQSPKAKAAMVPCRMDIGAYFTGYDGVDWHWGTQAAAVRKRHMSRGERPLVIQYRCHRRAAGTPGCAIARLTFRNGTAITLPEPAGVLKWFRTSPEPWIRIVLVQQDSLEYSYSKPESLRDTIPLTRCPIHSAPAFRVRELALKCETFAFMQPRPTMMAALLPSLKRLEPYERVVGVHLRTGYADWAFRNDDSYFTPNSSRSLSPHEHWRTLDHYFRDCSRELPGPCFNWIHPHKGRPPRMADALDCGGRRVRRLKPLELGTPKGFLTSLLTCATRLAQSMSISEQPGGRAARRHPGAALAAAEERKWGLLVLSDAPAVPSLAANLPALHGRVVSTAGAGQLGHSSFDRSCSAARGCSLGLDPGGAWTRSLVDFYLAGAADGFVKGVFTSFLFSTMRRNLLCCEGGAFVQWMAWYNLSRTHRDLPMSDRGFMAALATTHRPGDAW